MKLLVFNQFWKRQIKSFPVKKFTIQGESMMPTLKPGDTILASPLPYWFGKPQKDDIVVCLDPRDKRILIKRIAKIGDKRYFVCGDNPNASTDSKKFGMIERKDIIGKVIDIRS